MEIVPLKTVHGEGKAWDEIAKLRPEDVCRNSSVTFDAADNAYSIQSYGLTFTVSQGSREISCISPDGALFLGKLKDFFRLPILWYLVTSKDVPSTGRLLKPIDIKGGQRFFTGTHLLPLDRIAQKYCSDKSAFLQRGRHFGAEILSLGDASIRLFPLPRVPVTLILWLEDEEFPPRVDLLFDSSCEFQIALSDIIWSLAVMTCLVMLED